ncbi:uncharacterized protein [Vulpes vulpes]|uniref:Uncharacterized protein n=1 Tax=Vulpes vulpes TaxID=9627 RepID=A0A3Q7R772_VULVU
MQTLLVSPVSPNVDLDPCTRGELREKWGNRKQFLSHGMRMLLARRQEGRVAVSRAVLLPRPPTAALPSASGLEGLAGPPAALPNPCSSAGGGFGGAPGLTAAKASGETGSPGSPSSKGPPRKSRKGGGGDPADARMRSLGAQPAGAPTPELTGLQGAKQQQEHSRTGKKQPERQGPPLWLACGDDSRHPQPLTRSWSSLLNHKTAVKAEDPRCVGGCGTQQWAAAGLGESPPPLCWSPRVPSRLPPRGPASKYTHARPQVSHERPHPPPPRMPPPAGRGSGCLPPRGRRSHGFRCVTR